MTAPDARVPQLQIYRVGGSVRDELLGLPAGDRDWVVVGATPEQMLAQGFQAVGKDFPVFLHPQSHEEYALARTERKTAPGYKGFAVHFSPDVTLEDDLLRRDLTINAIARAADGSLVDPFDGQADIQARIFRHVSPAFREDPVRILRLARFAARFPDFTIAPETLTLMREMTAAGEVHALVAERVWQELSRGLMSQRPSRMLQVLEQAMRCASSCPPSRTGHPARLADGPGCQRSGPRSATRSLCHPAGGDDHSGRVPYRTRTQNGDIRHRTGQGPARLQRMHRRRHTVSQ